MKTLIQGGDIVAYHDGGHCLLRGGVLGWMGPIHGVHRVPQKRARSAQILGDDSLEHLPGGVARPMKSNCRR